MSSVTPSSEVISQSSLSPKFQAKALKELREDPEQRHEAIETIRQWLEWNDAFYSRTDEVFILKFLRSCKFDVEKTKKRITKYYNVRKSIPEWFDRTQDNFDVIIELIEQRLGMVMNFEGNYDENIVIVKPGYYDYHTYDIQYIGTSIAQCCDVFTRDPRTMIGGVQFVIDCKDLKLGGVMQITPNLLYKFINCFQSVMPVRIKGIHLLNAPSIVNKLLHFAKIFLTKKLRSRLFIHEDEKLSLTDVFPPEALPFEYGGTAGPAQKFIDNMREIIEDGREYLFDDDQYGIDKYPRGQ